MCGLNSHMATFVANIMQAYLANIIVIEVQLRPKIAALHLIKWKVAQFNAPHQRSTLSIEILQHKYMLQAV